MSAGPDTRVSGIEGASRSTLERLESFGLLREPFSPARSRLIDGWQFPMYDLDMSRKLDNRKDLHERQRNRHPKGRRASS